MWTGGEPPPPLPPPPPSAVLAGDGGGISAATTTTTTNAAATRAAANAPPQQQQQQQAPRPSQQRLSELEELRQKGLATLLNKHFTGVITNLSKEKAEADAQLRDLEQRKAATSEFEASRQGQLSPFDSMYVQLKKKRSECRRKERETLLLYQRYVHKFGATGVVQVPATATVTPPPVSSPPPDNYMLTRSNSESVLVPTMAHAIDQKVTELKQMGVDPIPTRDRMGVDTTYQTLHARDAMELQQFFRRQLEERGIDARCCTVSPGTVNPRKLFHGPRFPGGLPQLMESPGSPDSKQINATPWQYAFPGELSSPLYHHQEEGDDDEEEEDDDGAAGVVGVGTDRYYYQPQQQYQEYMQDVGGFSGYVVNNNYVMGANDDDEDYDDRSMVSGLTSVNSAATMLMHETENRLVQFLKTETEAIRKMLAEESHVGSSSGGGDDTRSVKSSKSTGAAAGGGTSVVSSDHNSTAQRSTSQVSSHHSEMGSHSSRAADQAEHMVKQMQDILNQFQQEAAARGETIVVATNADGITTTTTTTTAAAAPSPRKVPTSNPKEEWVAYFDDTYQKEYFHEVNSNRTQWELPEGAMTTPNTQTTTASTSKSASPNTALTSANSSDGGANAEAASQCTATSATGSSMTDYGQQQSSLHKTALLISHEDVMPDHHLNQSQRRDMLGTSLNSMSSGGGGRSAMSSRRSMYLKRRRRQRNRRLVAAVFATTVMAGMTLVWKHQYHAQESWPDAAKVMVGEGIVNQVLHVHHVTVHIFSQVIGTSNNNNNNNIKERSLLQDNSKSLPRELPVANVTASVVEVQVEPAVAPVITPEAVVVEDISNTTRAAVVEQEEVPKEDVKEDVVVVETVVEEDVEERVVRKNNVAVAVLEEEDTSLVVANKIRRPWLCNLPLAWLFHPTCWRLAHEAPLYCAHSLANSMMQ